MGWGTRENPPHGSTLECAECGGVGITEVQSETTYFWSAPTFVDYSGRMAVLISKIMAVIFSLIIILLLILLIKFMIVKTMGG